MSGPQFSHITVGQTDERAVALSEDEEVTAIGAVDTVSTLNVKDAEGVRSSEVDGAGSQDVNAAVPARDEDVGDAEDLGDLGAPMSLPYKIVASACGIGVIVVIAYLVNYYLIAPH